MSNEHNKHHDSDSESVTVRSPVNPVRRVIDNTQPLTRNQLDDDDSDSEPIVDHVPLSVYTQPVATTTTTKHEQDDNDSDSESITVRSPKKAFKKPAADSDSKPITIPSPVEGLVKACKKHNYEYLPQPPTCCCCDTKTGLYLWFGIGLTLSLISCFGFVADGSKGKQVSDATVASGILSIVSYAYPIYALRTDDVDHIKYSAFYLIILNVVGWILTMLYIYDLYVYVFRSPAGLIASLCISLIIQLIIVVHMFNWRRYVIDLEHARKGSRSMA